MDNAVAQIGGQDGLPMKPLEAWTVAARVHTLPAAVTPVLVGAGLAVHDGVFRIDALIWTLVGALAIQVAANFANDASDAHRGADSDDRLGPPRMVSAGLITPRRMWLATAVAVAVAAVAGVALTLI
ncbi:MAG: UbiA family prenyltransferase, partial [Acidimicrobiia bacterium]